MRRRYAGSSGCSSRAESLASRPCLRRGRAARHERELRCPGGRGASAWSRPRRRTSVPIPKQAPSSREGTVVRRLRLVRARESSGSSHARFTSSSATEGGKAGRSPASRSVIEAAKALGFETSSPFPNDSFRQTPLCRDRRQGLADAQIKNHVSANDHPELFDPRAATALELRELISGEDDSQRGLSPWRHGPTTDQTSTCAVNLNRSPASGALY